MFKGSSNIFRSKCISRLYHSADHPSSNMILNPLNIETKILSQAITHIPKYGFSSQCITEAIRELKYPDSIHSVLTSSTTGKSLEYQLSLHYLKFQRDQLQQEIFNKNSKLHEISNEYDRAAYLLKKRLELNGPYINKLSQAMSQLILPYNWYSSMEELHDLSDDIAFYAGDTSNDFAWYTKRGGLSTIYLSSELYQLQDSSPNFINTKNFVDEKVNTLRSAGRAYNDVEEWGYFNAISMVNLIKSQLLRG